MAHKGKFYPYFFWRDLCGEARQNDSGSSPKRWYFSSLEDGAGTYVAWANTNRPRSYPGQRVDWEPKIEWEWPAPGVSVFQGMYMSMEWFVDLRKLTLIFEAYWSGGGLAHVQIDSSPPRSTSLCWSSPQTFIGPTSTDEAIWKWPTTLPRTLELRRAPWPDEPNP